MNGRNTHNKAAFYEAFPPKTAYWLAQKFEMHYNSQEYVKKNGKSDIAFSSFMAYNIRRLLQFNTLNRHALKRWNFDRIGEK